MVQPDGGQGGPQPSRVKVVPTGQRSQSRVIQDVGTIPQGAAKGAAKGAEELGDGSGRDKRELQGSDGAGAGKGGGIGQIHGLGPAFGLFSLAILGTKGLRGTRQADTVRFCAFPSGKARRDIACVS